MFVYMLSFLCVYTGLQHRQLSEEWSVRPATSGLPVSVLWWDLRKRTVLSRLGSFPGHNLCMIIPILETTCACYHVWNELSIFAQLWLLLLCTTLTSNLVCRLAASLIHSHWLFPREVEAPLRWGGRDHPHVSIAWLLSWGPWWQCALCDESRECESLTVLYELWSK